MELAEVVVKDLPRLRSGCPVPNDQRTAGSNCVCSAGGCGSVIAELAGCLVAAPEQLARERETFAMRGRIVRGAVAGYAPLE